VIESGDRAQTGVTNVRLKNIVQKHHCNLGRVQAWCGLPVVGA
jgi:hypothetical protein